MITMYKRLCSYHKTLSDVSEGNKGHNVEPLILHKKNILYVSNQILVKNQIGRYTTGEIGADGLTSRSFSMSQSERVRP